MHLAWTLEMFGPTQHRRIIVRFFCCRLVVLWAGAGALQDGITDDAAWERRCCFELTPFIVLRTCPLTLHFMIAPLPCASVCVAGRRKHNGAHSAKAASEISFHADRTSLDLTDYLIIC